MKIVDRTTFLAMPEGTVFSKFAPCYFEDMCIKGETIGGCDFCVQAIGDAIAYQSEMEFTSAMQDAMDHGDILAMDFNTQGRDGCFDDAQLFAVWDSADVEALIARLQVALLEQKVMP